MKGKINLCIGPMYSGKTSTLLSRLERYKVAGKKCIIIKYINDNRYGEGKVITHNKYSHEAISTDLLTNMDNFVKDYDVIMIDEIQFYDDAAYKCDEWANKNKVVECFGLNGDFERKPFEQISLLVPLSDNITHLKAVETDSTNSWDIQDAPFTFRIGNSNEKELIGGKEMYKALSRENYLKYTKSQGNIEAIN